MIFHSPFQYHFTLSLTPLAPNVENLLYGTYIPNQKYDPIRISVVCDITKIWWKPPISKILRIFTLHNNNAEKLLTNRYKNYCLINNQVTDPFCISNEVIDFSESIFFFIFTILQFLQFFLRSWKYRFWKKNRGYNRETVRSITRKILVHDMESCDKSISKIRIRFVS